MSRGGFAEVLVRWDNELAILALKESAATALKLANDAVRTNLASLVRRSGQEFQGGHPVLPWLVMYSVAMVNRCRRGPDGETAYELRKGREHCRILRRRSSS